VHSDDSITRYIWRSPRYRSNDLTRTVLILKYIQTRTLTPVPAVLSFSAVDNVLTDRYILTDCLPGLDLASALNDANSCLSVSLKARLQMAETVAGLMADVHGITLPGEEGLIGDVCVNERDHVQVKSFPTITQ